MDVGSLTAAYLDEYRLNASAAGLAGRVERMDADKGGSDFAGLLKKAVRQNDGGERVPKAAVDKTDKLYEQCLELETFLVKTLIGSMRSTIQKSGLIDESFAGKMYEDMLYDEYAKDFAKNAGFGLAEQAYLELSGRRGEVIIRQTI
ncbi:MAG: rod-binding protein [Treponema sp.]|jgi:flagellar protein FlgJ|nr:rod-binding protein [Treponema sp.]